MNEQPSFAVDAAAIAGKAGIRADGPMARNHDGDWVRAVGKPGTAVSDCLAGGSSVAAGASSQAARCRVALIACRVGPGQANASAARWGVWRGAQSVGAGNLRDALSGYANPSAAL